MFRAILGGLLEGLKECVSGLKFLVPGPDSRLSEVEKIIWWRGFGKSIGVYSPWVFVLGWYYHADMATIFTNSNMITIVVILLSVLALWGGYEIYWFFFHPCKCSCGVCLMTESPWTPFKQCAHCYSARHTPLEYNY